MSAENRFLESHTPRAEMLKAISPTVYSQYNVKRGLRNEDGTGVLVGLTEIGEVHGYILDEGERTPVPGRLRYRGIDLSELVAGFQRDGRFGFEEATYLLLFGDLPSATELQEFNSLLGQKRDLPDGFWENVVTTSPSQNIMNKLAASVLAAYTYDENPEDLSVRNVLRQSINLIATFPTLIAYAYQSKRKYYDNKSLYIHSPDPALSTAENFLRMIRPSKEYSALEAELLDLSLVLHAEHGGGNNSAFTVHVVSSSYTDTYSAIAAAIGSLKGVRHGGANNRVMGQMADLQSQLSDWGDEAAVRAYLEETLDGKIYDNAGLIYGLGHAVYTVSDPRAVLLKEKAIALANENGFEKELELYKLVERLGPEILRKRKGKDLIVAPNVDFYSGFVYKMLDIPPELYTPMFAMSRITGWCAHRIEEIASGGRIIRPAYKNVLGRRQYEPLERR